MILFTCEFCNNKIRETDWIYAKELCIICGEHEVYRCPYCKCRYFSLYEILTDLEQEEVE